MPGVALLVVVALGLRLPGLTTLGLYRDDAWPALALVTGWADAMRIGITTPGFELFLRAWLSVSRATPWAQAPALIASVLAVVGVYCLARRVGCHRVAAVAAGAMLALSPIGILFSTRVKPYQVDALSTVAIITAALAVADRPTSRRWALLVVLSGAAAFFSASTLAASVSAVAWCAVVSRRGHDRQSRRLALVFPLGFLALVGVYAGVVLGSVPPSLHDSWTGNYLDASSPAALVSSTFALFGSFAAGVFPTTPGLAALLVVGLAAGALWYRPPVAALVLAPVVVALGLALVQRAPFGGGRVDIYLYPCVALLGAMAAQKVLDTDLVPPRLAGAALAGAVVLVAATIGVRHVGANPYPGVAMGQLTEAVRERMEPGDALVVGAFSRYPYALYGGGDPEVVFSPRYAPGFTVRSGNPDVLIMPAEFFEGDYDERLALRFVEGRSRVWYLATDTPPSDTPAAVQVHEYRPEQQLIAEGFRIADRIDAHGVHADLLVRPPPPTGPDGAAPSLRPPPGGAGRPGDR